MFIVPLGEAVIHWYIIEKLKRPIDHMLASLIRGVIIAVFVLLHGFGLLLLLPLYWVTFHYSLNILRGKQLSYLGTNWFDIRLYDIDELIGTKTRVVLHILIALALAWMNLIL